MLDAARDHAQIPLARFQFAPLTEQDVEWLYLDGQIPADHVARLVIERLKSLDLTLLWQSYQGRGIEKGCSIGGKAKKVNYFFVEVEPLWGLKR